MTPEYTPEQQAIIDRYSYEIVGPMYDPDGSDTSFRRKLLRDGALNFALLIYDTCGLLQTERDSALMLLSDAEKVASTAIARTRLDKGNHDTRIYT